MTFIKLLVLLLCFISSSVFGAVIYHSQVKCFRYVQSWTEATLGVLSVASTTLVSSALAKFVLLCVRRQRV